jgi:hypothetical protein
MSLWNAIIWFKVTVTCLSKTGHGTWLDIHVDNLKDLNFKQNETSKHTSNAVRSMIG